MRAPHDCGDLRERLARGFVYGDAEHPWGITGEDLAALHGRGPAETLLYLAASEAYGLDTVRHLARAPRNGPVLAVSYYLAATSALQSDGGLAAFRARVDAALGPGQHQPIDRLRPGGVAATSRWAAGPVTVGLSAFTQLRGDGADAVAGVVSVATQLALLAGPYLPAYWGKGAAWTVTSGVVDPVTAPGLRAIYGGPAADRAAYFAVSRRDLRATPAWVASSLGKEEVGIWDHPASGTWGLGDREVSLVVPAGASPPVLEHVRIRPARGAGGAKLQAGPGRPVLQTAPGPAGLDRVVERLASRPVIIRRVEADDD